MGVHGDYYRHVDHWTSVSFDGTISPRKDQKTEQGPGFKSAGLTENYRLINHLDGEKKDWIKKGDSGTDLLPDRG